MKQFLSMYTEEEMERVIKLHSHWDIMYTKEKKITDLHYYYAIFIDIRGYIFSNKLSVKFYWFESLKDREYFYGSSYNFFKLKSCDSVRFNSVDFYSYLFKDVKNDIDSMNFFLKKGLVIELIDEKLIYGYTEEKMEQLFTRFNMSYGEYYDFNCIRCALLNTQNIIWDNFLSREFHHSNIETTVSLRHMYIAKYGPMKGYYTIGCGPFFDYLMNDVLYDIHSINFFLKNGFVIDVQI